MNIYDIAELAGVSIATVSRVVNDSPRVSEKTKAKVLAVMEENDYTPDVFARGMGLKTMKIVGIVCPSVSDVYMANAVAYLEKSLRRHGYDCILYCSGYEQEDKEKAVKRIIKKRIDALILVGSNYAGDGSEVFIQYIKEAAQKVPVFLINGYIRCQGVYCVLADNYQAVYDAVSALLQAGRKKILFLHDSLSYSGKEKLRGYEDALLDHGLPVLDIWKIRTENKISKTRDLLLMQEKLEFDAVMTTEDGLAAGAVKYAGVRGIRIPEALSIIGYNNSELSVCCEPELTSIDSRGEELCETAIDLLMQLIKGEPVKHKNIVQCRLVERGTTELHQESITKNEEETHESIYG